MSRLDFLPGKQRILHATAYDFRMTDPRESQPVFLSTRFFSTRTILEHVR